MTLIISYDAIISDPYYYIKLIGRCYSKINISIYLNTYNIFTYYKKYSYLHNLIINEFGIGDSDFTGTGHLILDSIKIRMKYLSCDMLYDDTMCTKGRLEYLIVQDMSNDIVSMIEATENLIDYKITRFHVTPAHQTEIEVKWFNESI